jgi:hypothetical protein
VDSKDYTEYTYKDVGLYYNGPLLRSGNSFGTYSTNPAVCKYGWCNEMLDRAIVMNAFMDQSECHDGVEYPKEEALGIDTASVPFERAKTVMYAVGIIKPVVTDYVVVACCHRIGAFMVQARRKHIEWKTKNLFRVTWDSIPANEWRLDMKMVGRLCEPNKVEESIDELRFFRVILIKMYIACDPTTRLLNRILLSPLDFGDNIPKESDLEVID